MAGSAARRSRWSACLLPSTTLALCGHALGRASAATSRGVRAFTAGLAPLTIGLLLSTGWVLALPHAHATGGLRCWGSPPSC